MHITAVGPPLALLQYHCTFNIKLEKEVMPNDVSTGGMKSHQRSIHWLRSSSLFSLKIGKR